MTIETHMTVKGRKITAARVRSSTAASQPVYLGWGTSTGLTSTSNALIAASTEARVVGTPSNVTVTSTGDTYQVVGTITNGSAGTKTIKEAGLFTAATGGDMYACADWTSGTSVGAGASATFTFKAKYTST